MAKRVLLGLLVLWCCWGAWRLIAAETGPGAPDLVDEDPTARRAATPDPVGLEARGARPAARDPRSSAKPHVSRVLPEWLTGGARLTEMADRDRFLAWLRGDPRRILDLLFRGLDAVPGDRRSLEAIYRNSAETLGGDTEALAFLVPVLLTEFDASKEKWLHMAALLGALSRMGPALDEEESEAVVMLAARADLHREIRVLAVLAGLNYPGLEAKQAAAVSAAIGVAWPVHRRTLMRLLDRLRELGPQARVLLPSLLALHDSVSMNWWSRAPALEVLLAIAPNDPRVFDATVRALASDGPHRRLARGRLLGGGAAGRQRLLAFLETAGGAARVHGVALLLEDGAPGSEVGHLLLPALTDDNALVRSRAVALLPRAGQTSGAVLPSIEALFASKDPEKWLTATAALGALSRLPGDRQPVVDLLFTAVRMPETRVRVTAVQTLLMYDGENARIVPLLADLLDDTEADVRREAVDGLGELSAHDKIARGHLEAALGDADETVREVARYWLKEGDEESDDD